MDDRDDVMALVGDVPPLLPCSQVDAVCSKIVTVNYGPYRQTKYRFDLKVIEPEEFAQTTLNMFVRIDPRWKTVPISSKLWKMACVANGKSLSKGQKITKKLFLNKLYRCQLKEVGTGSARYSIVDRLLEVLAG